MTIAWTCAAHPTDHGTFWRKGLEFIQARDPLFQRGIGKMHRFACPRCCVEHKAGHVRPATHEETHALIQSQRAA